MTAAAAMPVQMTGKEFSDAEAGAKWALEFGQYIANSKGWTAAQKKALEDDISESLLDADEASWWGYDPATFWSVLRDRASTATWLSAPGGADVARTFGAAVQAADSAASKEEAAQLTTQVAGAVVASAQDANSIAQSANKAAQNPVVWVAVAAIAVLILVKK